MEFDDGIECVQDSLTTSLFDWRSPTNEKGKLCNL